MSLPCFFICGEIASRWRRARWRIDRVAKRDLIICFVVRDDVSSVGIPVRLILFDSSGEIVVTFTIIKMKKVVLIDGEC